MTARVAPGGTRTSASSLRQSKLPPHSNARTAGLCPRDRPAETIHEKEERRGPSTAPQALGTHNSEMPSEPRPSTGSESPASTREPDRTSSIAA